jgi:nucleoside 2-deoxyribosyltransferase
VPVEEQQPRRNLASVAAGDIAALRGAEVMVASADSIEMPSGSAALLGLARALGKRVVLVDSKATSLVAGPQYKSSRNLMIECSADRIVKDLASVPAVVFELLHTANR